MSIETQQPPLRPGDRVRFIYDRDHVETVESCEWVAAPSAAMARLVSRMARARAELARQNPESLERENAEFEATTDAELAAIPRLAGPQHWQVVTNWPGNHRVADAAEFVIEEEGAMMGADGFGEISFADRYGADVTEAATGLLMIPDAGVTSSDELWLKWEALDRLLGEVDERAHKEAGGVIGPLYEVRRDELQAPLFHRLNEIEARIAGMVPATIQDCLAQVRLLNARWPACPTRLDDLIVDNLLAGLEVMAAGGG